MLAGSALAAGMYIRYFGLVTASEICDRNSVSLFQDWSSCASPSEVRNALVRRNITFETKIDTKKEADWTRPGLVITVMTTGLTEWKGIVGTARFEFVNDRLSSISIFPSEDNVESAESFTTTENTSNLGRKSGTNYLGSKYVRWYDQRLETYIRSWIDRFS